MDRLVDVGPEFHFAVDLIHMSACTSICKRACVLVPVVHVCALMNEHARDSAHACKGNAVLAPPARWARSPQSLGGMAQVLHRLGFDQSSVPKTLKAQTRLLLFNYWATYCILKARRPKFVALEPPLLENAPQAAVPREPLASAAPKPVVSKQPGALVPPEEPKSSGSVPVAPQLSQETGQLVS